jgi:hypothetical protein
LLPDELDEFASNLFHIAARHGTPLR